MAEYIFEIGEALYNEKTGETVMKPTYKGKIVRCRECKWWELTPDNTKLPDWHRCRFYGTIHTRVDEFCSRGERNG